MRKRTSGVVWKSGNVGSTKNRYANVRKGYALDLADDNYYMSGWERDFARFLTYLQALGIVSGWEYEPYRFNFIGHYNSNPLFYVPDFVVDFSMVKEVHSLNTLLPDASPGHNLYVEVKGQETGRDRNKWKRFRKVTGNKLNVVKRAEMKFLQDRFSDLVPNWESNIV